MTIVAQAMKKVALLFVLAVILPSLALAWLALRSLSDQQFVLERQQTLLYQGVADALAKEAQDYLSEELRGFGLEVESLLVRRSPADVARTFDDNLRTNWPLAAVAFVVTTDGQLLSPQPAGRAEVREFYAANGLFLSNREAAEVYWNAGKSMANAPAISDAQTRAAKPSEAPSGSSQLAGTRSIPGRALQTRNVYPQQQALLPGQSAAAQEEAQAYSRFNTTEAEFQQLSGEAGQGMLARFLGNRLSVLFWYRSARAPGLIFGAQIALGRLTQDLRGLLDELNPALRQEVCVALLDDAARPVTLSQPGFKANWKRPFVAAEIGEALPHWEVAVYVLDPQRLSQTARTLRLTLGLLVALFLLVISIGSVLIVRDLNRQLRLARQKTDFVGNVSHELKTPLTSIRMFAELLAEGRVSDPDKQSSYLTIITAEAARLTRLINNVLDFSRLERGEKKYNFQNCDLVEVVRETCATLRPHLETGGFRFACELPDAPLAVRGDRDALAQVLVNLLSNAEKYADATRDITVRARLCQQPLPHVEVSVLDRGLGVPRGAAEKIFEQFYRAHDSLNSGIQGSGLGLTLARQIARAHGGDVVYEPRDGGGSSFSLRLPCPPHTP
jgi:signal transduction histidine kinase